jgi:hypothetical protein
MSGRGEFENDGDLLEVDTSLVGSQSIPHALANDTSISVAARGLALVLACRHAGRSIRISGLHKTVGCGRDSLRRLLKELQEARYLLRESRRDEAGRWKWRNRFSPVPYPKGTGDWKPVTGVSVTGPPGVGSADAGTPVDKEHVVVVLKKNTTTTPAVADDEHPPGGHDRADQRDTESLDLRHVFEGAEAREALAMLAKCPPSARQDVIDDIAGKASRNRLRGPPLNLLYTLIQRAREGSFSAADAIAFRAGLERKAAELEARAKQVTEQQREPTEAEKEKSRLAREEAMARLAWFRPKRKA